MEESPHLRLDGFPYSRVKALHGLREILYTANVQVSTGHLRLNQIP